MCSTKVYFLKVNVNEFNTYDVQAISTRATQLNYNEIVKFAFVWTIFFENLQDVIIVTVSNFVKSGSITDHPLSGQENQRSLF